MRYLLDTHVFLWVLDRPERLGASLDLLGEETNALMISAVTAWEITIKHRLGKLVLPDIPSVYVPSRIRAIGAEPIAIEHSHVLAVETLPDLHRDPFDRLLVAQAQMLGLTIVTADRAVAAYPVATILV